MIELNAFAKINLFLDVVGLRDDGYHEVVTLMQSVSLCDRITLEKSDTVSIIGNYGVLPEKDLAYRAAKLFFESTGVSGGVTVRVAKNIPMQGGLAGGSADAAAVLNGLNMLYGTGLDDRFLENMAAKLGSDVPFCIRGGTQLAFGRGEKLSKAEQMKSCGIVIVAGSKGASTPMQYRELDRIHNGFVSYEPNTAKLEALLKAESLQDISDNLFNIFEQTNGYDRTLANKLKYSGAESTLLCGSGSSVFGLFKDLDKANIAANELNNMGVKAFACKPQSL